MKLSHQLKMSPQLQQAIKLLQVSRLELESSIHKELMTNPLLEEVVDSIDSVPKKDGRESDAPTSSNDEYNTGCEGDGEDLSYNWKKLKKMNAISLQTKEGFDLDNVLSSSKTLREHLIWQLSFIHLDEKQKEVAKHIIDDINDDGYYKGDLSEVAQQYKMAEDAVEDVLLYIQDLEPAGVASRNLKENLLLQAEYYQEDTKDILHIINNHLSHLKQRNYKAIASAMSISVDLVQELCEVILSFNPNPGRQFLIDDNSGYIVPDVFIHRVGDEYIVSLNNEGLPQLALSKNYQDWNKKKDMKPYVQERFKAAVWFIRSISQRQKTIYKVTESIVKQQKGFFEKGVQYIEPMILKNIANDIDVHESTVSRVVANKYVSTPMGTFPLKFFFNTGISCSGGRVMSSVAIRNKVKAMVAQEDITNPLSDQRIMEMLEQEGVRIARRTVSKYREALNILPSVKRKKLA